VLYHLLYSLSPQIGALNVTRYITFRTAAASISALVISLVMGPWLIRTLREFQIGQVIRQEGPQSHRAKAGTPTMGGLLILVAALVPTLLWADLTNPFIWIAVVSTAAFGAVGFLDDYLKITRRSSGGLAPRYKLAGQIVVGLAVGGTLLWLASRNQYTTRLIFPFFKQLIPDLGWFYLPFSVLLLTFSSNAVNLTDGLDGLAIMPIVMVGSALGVFAYVTGNAVFSRYLLFPHIPGAGELLVFCAAMAGAGLAFLWFNANPAQVFMGDVGALSLGGALGTIAVITRQEIVLGIMGGIFVAEALSVMLQVLWFKYTKRRYGEGRRIFLMAPLHHHFEKKGWTETQVVVRFWIITMLLCLVGLASLKLR